jgi:hypothetical protein
VSCSVLAEDTLTGYANLVPSVFLGEENRVNEEKNRKIHVKFTAL